MRVNDIVSWWYNASIKEREEFLVKCGGEFVTESVCYMYPSNERDYSQAKLEEVIKPNWCEENMYPEWNEKD